MEDDYARNRVGTGRQVHLPPCNAVASLRLIHPPWQAQVNVLPTIPAVEFRGVRVPPITASFYYTEFTEIAFGQGRVY